MRIFWAIGAIFLIPACGVDYKYHDRFTSTVTNQSSYVLTSEVHFRESNFDDDCEFPWGDKEGKVHPGDTATVRVESRCQRSPDSGATVTYPFTALVDESTFEFQANAHIVCNDQRCYVN